jgi:phosphoglycolate phosphatase-like HAD superfamily hydrolase
MNNHFLKSGLSGPGMILLLVSIWAFSAQSRAQSPLASWNDTPSRSAILGFVERVTNPESPDFVPPAQRIAVFDNDGTLWSEQPMYVQLAFVLDRVQALADQNPHWRQQQPFKSVLEGDLAALSATGEKGLLELMTATHAGMSTEQFADIVQNWLATARHPKYHRPYTECVYLPMLELLDYLRSHQFKTYIVSGGGVEFMRPWVESVYGIPPEQVIGSSVKVQYDVQDGKPRLLRLPEIDFIDDKAGKPVGIHKFIGRRPLMAFGNSDGDYQMLQYVTSGNRPGFGLIVHHTDPERETAYDRQSPFGRLDKALEDANKFGWTVVDIQRDWKQVFAFENQPN